MGPPIYIGGNQFFHLSLLFYQLSFNGATDLHRWKHIGETSSNWSYLASMGPPIYIGGNKKVPYILWMGWMASMGPPIYIGGNDLVPFQNTRIALLQWGHRFTSVETEKIRNPNGFGFRFNGATDLHRWKHYKTKDDIYYYYTLQWGHRFTSVETSRNNIRSNGYSRLQWGHRFTSVETAVLSTSTTIHT